MKFSLLYILLVLTSCTSNGQEKIKGKYLTDSKESYITIFGTGINDTIRGKHCFVFFNGERIDCCVDEQYSFTAKKKSKTVYEGTLLSCYDNLEYRIRITFEKSRVNFRFIDGSHPFIPKELKLYKE